MCFAGAAGAAGAASSSGSTGSLLGGLAQIAPSVISAGGKAATAGEGASAQGSVLNYYQNNALINQTLASQRSADAIQQGENQAVQLEQKTAQLKGKQRAAFAANGVRLDSGSPVAVQASTDYMRDVDLATIRTNAARAAWGQQVQAGNFGANSAAYGAAASQVSPVGSAATSLLGSASGVAGQWYNLYKNGGFGASTDTSFNNPADYG